MIVEGKKVPGKLTKLKLGELSLVDFGANARANVTIFKRGEGREVAKRNAVAHVVKVVTSIVKAEQSGARTFDTILAETEARERAWEAYRVLSPLFEALTCSIQSIAADASLTTETRIGLVRDSVQGFLNAVAETLPDVQEEITKLCTTDEAVASFFAAKTGGNDDEDSDMDKDARIRELEGSVSTLTTNLKAAENALAKAKTDHDAAVADLQKRLDPDQELTVGGEIIKRSEIGAGPFKLLKAQQEENELTKAMQTAEKEFGLMPGTAVEKGGALRAIAKMADGPRSILTKMLVAGQKALSEASKSRGKDRTDDGDGSAGEGDDEDDVNVGKARKEYKGLVAKAMKAGKSEAAAEVEVLNTKRGAELYEIIDAARGAVSDDEDDEGTSEAA